MQAIELFLSSARGVYIPKNFAEMIDRDRLKCDNGAIHELGETLDFLIDCDPYGEDADLYWQEWCCLVDNCYIEHNGHIWRLWHDGDLWLYCDELMTDQEKSDFFGEV